MEAWRSSGLARGTPAAKCGKHLVPLVTLRQGHNQEQGDALGDCLLLASREHPGTHSQKLREKLAFQVSILVAQTVKGLPTMLETQVRSLGWEDPLEKEMATHSSTRGWKIPWMKDPGGLQSMGSQRVRHDFTFTIPFCVCTTSLSVHLTMDI